MVLLPLRIFLAAGWLRASAEKMIDPAWWHGDGVRSFIGKQHDVALPFFRPVMQNVLAPVAVHIAVVVAVGQALIGLAIAFGRPVRFALWCGAVLNVVFVLCGKVNPSAFYLVMEGVLLFGVSAGHIGRRPKHPSVRSFVLIGIWLTLAAVMAPFVRTVAPAKVIEDPAMMLLFLSLTMAGTTFARWIHHFSERITLLTDIPLRPVQTWMRCFPISDDALPPSASATVEQIDHRQLNDRIADLPNLLAYQAERSSV